MMKNKILWVSFIVFLAGCGGQNIFESPDDVRKHQTTGLVATNDTLYTEGLKCLGKLIEESGQAGQITASVGQIQDKTAKELDTSIQLTQAAPDMALNALGEIGAVDLIGITDVSGLAQVDTSKCDVNQVGALGSISCLGSQFFLTGAISEFNKDIRNRSWGFTFFRKLLDTGVSGEDSVINVAMDLRLVASSGKILRNSKKELLMVSLQNNVVTRSIDGNLFRTWTDLGAGANFALKTNDPQHLAIREIIDRGTLILVGKLFEVDWQKCDVPKISAKDKAKAKIISAGNTKTELSKDPGDIPGVTVRAADEVANWSKSLISKLVAGLANKKARSVYVSTSKMKDQTTDYFEAQLLAALRDSKVFKPRPGNTLPTSKLDKMSAKKLRKTAESRPGLSILAALLGVDNQLNWKVIPSGSNVTVTVALVNGKSQKQVTASETFALSELPKNIREYLDEIYAGIHPNKNLAVLKPDLVADFVTTHGKGLVAYNQAKNIRFLVRLNNPAYTYFFLVNTKSNSVKRLYPTAGTGKKLDANKVWVFPNDVNMGKVKIDSSGQYMLLGIASEKPIQIPENVSLEWLQRADQIELVHQGLNVGEYTDMGVMLQASL